MKKHILKIENGRWLVNGKKSDQWDFDETKFVNKFIRKVKKNPKALTNLQVTAQPYLAENNGCNPFTWLLRFVFIKKQTNNL